MLNGRVLEFSSATMAKIWKSFLKYYGLQIWQFNHSWSMAKIQKKKNSIPIYHFCF